MLHDDSSEMGKTYNIADFFSMAEGKNVGNLPVSLSENTFERVRTFVLNGMVCACAGLSFFMNLFEEDSVFLYPLLAVLIASLLALFLLVTGKCKDIYISVFLWVILMLLGLFIVIFDQSPDHRSLLWVNIFPPICILTMGLRMGSILFLSFLALLMMLFFTPLSNIVLNPIDFGTQLRLLICMAGSFMLVGCIEYARSSTYKALQNAVMHIGQTSLTDALTGLGNRRYFDKFLEWVMANAQRAGQSYAVVLLDIDHFKRVNDTFGHDLGDEVLKHLAAELKKQIRTADMLFRWGGEEFVIVMPHCTPVEAEIAAERFRTHIQKTPYVFSTEKLYLTISLGIYAGHESADIKLPMAIADQCLYKAKSGGRNMFFINT